MESAGSWGLRRGLGSNDAGLAPGRGEQKAWFLRYCGDKSNSLEER